MTAGVYESIPRQESMKVFQGKKIKQKKKYLKFENTSGKQTFHIKNIQDRHICNM